MKNIILCFSVLTVVSCDNSSVKEKPDMPGAYFMTVQILNDGKEDTKYTTLKQLKIYTKDFMMYTQVNSVDSVSAFGIGSYIADTGTVIENIIYRSRDTIYNNTPVSYKLAITKKPEGYGQVIPQITIDFQKYKLTENYQVVGKAVKSPLDGMWKLTSSYKVNGKDTVRDVRTQYKAFYMGYFMWGHTIKDSASKNHTGIGFGTFETAGNNKIKETDLNSTYQIIAGETFDVNLEMTGTDHYSQTITNADGTKGVEYYERFKK
ncbi:MAG: hypothetical protein ABIO55_04420 [Ginsengibacter sp.]